VSRRYYYIDKRCTKMGAWFSSSDAKKKKKKAFFFATL